MSDNKGFQGSGVEKQSTSSPKGTPQQPQYPQGGPSVTPQPQQPPYPQGQQVQYPQGGPQVQYPQGGPQVQYPQGGQQPPQQNQQQYAQQFGQQQQPFQPQFALPPQIQMQMQQMQNQLLQYQQNTQGLQQMLSKEKARADEYVQLAQRLQADFDNYRKRTKEESRKLKEDGMVEVIEKVVNALDVFKHAINLITDEKILEGVKMIYRQFSDVLSSFGVTEIVALGEQFDPDLHNAIVSVKAKDQEKSGTIVEVLQRGYIMGTRVIRHAAVKVAN